MNESNMLYEISVYIKGDNLAPDKITETLGINPTRSHEKGKLWTSPNGEEIKKITGLWSRSIKNIEISNFTKIIKNLGGEFSAFKGNINHLPGVESAYVDILLIKTMADEGNGACEFELDSGALSALNDLGLPVQFTVHVLMPEKHTHRGYSSSHSTGQGNDSQNEPDDSSGYRVNPETGDVINPQGDIIGNLADEL